MGLDSSALSTALDELEARVVVNEGTILSESTRLTTLETAVAGIDVSGLSTAISALDARVLLTEGSIISTASRIDSLESSVTDAEDDIVG